VDLDDSTAELERILNIRIDTPGKRKIVSVVEKLITVRAGRCTTIPDWMQEEWTSVQSMCRSVRVLTMRVYLVP